MKKLVLFLLFAMPLFIAYSFEIPFIGNDEIITETRTLPTYDQIEVSGAYRLVLTDGKVGEIIIKAPEKLLSSLETTVVNGILKIGISRKHSFNTKITVYVPVDNQLKRVLTKGAVNVNAEKALESDELELKIAGSGDMSAEVKANILNLKVSGAGDLKVQVNVNTLDVQISGAGDLKAYGTTKNLVVNVKGAGDVDAPNLKAEKAFLRIAGAGDITANVSKEVEAIILGAGDITVKGNPPVFSKTIKGVGRIQIE